MLLHDGEDVGGTHQPVPIFVGDDGEKEPTHDKLLEIGVNMVRVKSCMFFEEEEEEERLFGKINVHWGLRIIIYDWLCLGDSL